jgi:hypothetical protein
MQKSGRLQAPATPRAAGGRRVHPKRRRPVDALALLLHAVRPRTAQREVPSSAVA